MNELTKEDVPMAYWLSATWLAAIATTWLYSWIVYDQGIPDWAVAAKLSITMGIVIPLALRYQKQN